MAAGGTIRIADGTYGGISGNRVIKNVRMELNGVGPVRLVTP